jgi:hypothetical protein
MQTKFSTPTTYYKANAFGGTFAFLQPHKAKQKKQKSHQANAPRQTQNDNEQTRQRRRAAANSGLA